jgi:hypothetical protein
MLPRQSCRVVVAVAVAVAAGVNTIDVDARVIQQQFSIDGGEVQSPRRQVVEPHACQTHADNSSDEKTEGGDGFEQTNCATLHVRRTREQIDAQKN